MEWLFLTRTMRSRGRSNIKKNKKDGAEKGVKSEEVERTPQQITRICVSQKESRGSECLTTSRARDRTWYIGFH